jgi:hypothetical protein
MLTPNQIPTVWEAIKWAAKNADGVEEKDQEKYFTMLLHDLLSSKAQCFIHLDSDRRLNRIAITRVTVDNITGDKSLFVNCLYSFKRDPDEVWIDDMAKIKNYARDLGCKKILAWSIHERASEICRLVGFEERLKMFMIRLED